MVNVENLSTLSFDLLLMVMHPWAALYHLLPFLSDDSSITEVGNAVSYKLETSCPGLGSAHFAPHT